jgi:hypothetical protein
MIVDAIFGCGVGLIDVNTADGAAKRSCRVGLRPGIFAWAADCVVEY